MIAKSNCYGWVGNQWSLSCRSTAALKWSSPHSGTRLAAVQLWVSGHCVPGPGNSPPQGIGKPGTQCWMHGRAPELSQTICSGKAGWRPQKQFLNARELEVGFGLPGGVLQHSLSSRSISQYLIRGETHEHSAAWCCSISGVWLFLWCIQLASAFAFVLHLSICDSASRSWNGRCCMFDNIFFKSLWRSCSSILYKHFLVLGCGIFSKLHQK